MALFEFMQSVGDKFEAARQQELDAKAAAAAAAGEAEAAAARAEYEAAMTQALMDRIAGLGLGDADVHVSFSDGVVTLVGRVANADAHEQVVLAVGNVEGVRGVDDQLEAPEAPEPTFYTVQRGDSLSKIATKFYGKGSLYTVIFEANRPLLKDPNVIHPGQVLRIPPR